MHHVNRPSEMIRLRVFSFVFLGAAVVAGAGLALERQKMSVLSEAVRELREERDALTRLRAENEKLRATLPSAEILSVWKADHAAVLRLQTQINQARANVEGHEQALAEGRKSM